MLPLSIPKMGATDFGYKIAKQFGLKIINPEAALVPFTLSAEILEETKKLAGVSVISDVKIGNKIFREGLLFTHKGLSGPAILQISSYWQKNQEITINLAPKTDILTLIEAKKQENPQQDINNLLATIIPKSLANYILEKNNISGKLINLSKRKFKFYQII